MVCILETIWVILKIVRGLFINKFIQWVGSFANIIKVGALFVKRPQGGRFLN